jgi:uncharacterized OsmC-like protein
MPDKTLIDENTLKLYFKRLKKINRLGYSEEGDAEFIEELTATSEQIDNLHVKAQVNGFEVECDEPESIGGSGKAPNPLQLLVASMANCLELTAMMFFSLMGLDVSAVKVKVQASYDKRRIILKQDDTLPGLYDIKYTWYITANESQHTIESALKRVEESCPVKWTLQKDHNFSQDIILNNGPDK